MCLGDSGKWEIVSVDVFAKQLALHGGLESATLLHRHCVRLCDNWDEIHLWWRGEQNESVKDTPMVMKNFLGKNDASSGPAPWTIGLNFKETTRTKCLSKRFGFVFI